MAQLRNGKQSNGMGPPAGAKNDQRVNPEKSDRLEGILSEIETLSLLVERNILDLTQPMTVILGLSDLLRPHIDPDSPLATDLTALSKQVERMSQTLKEVNKLVEQKNRLVDRLTERHLDHPRHRFEQILISKREERK
jgi:signal transduction histidine kinase